MSDKGILTVAEAGRRGGNKTLERHGKEHFSRAGIAGGNVTKARHGKKHYQRLGRAAGRAIRAKRGLPPLDGQAIEEQSPGRAGPGRAGDD